VSDKKAKTVKLEVFDPPMCCSSGCCGPNVDKRLVDFSAALTWLKEQGVDVQRCNPAQQNKAFVGNAKVMKTVKEYGLGCLPLVLVGGEVVFKGNGGYPGKDELAVMAGIEGGKKAK
jgi:hypothetical protein